MSSFNKMFKNITPINLYKNGIHIMLLCIFFSFYDPLAAFYVFLKAHSAYYYIQFNHLYSNPRLFVWKHMIRLTDTGHIANALFYFDRSWLPVAHNVHFMISFGYYIAVFFFGMTDSDDIDNKEIIPAIHVFHSHVNHTMNLAILMYLNFHSQDNENGVFDNRTLFLSVMWTHAWLFFVYTPWKIMTSDPVYSVLSDSVPTAKKVLIILGFHLILYIGNEVGKATQALGLFASIAYLP